MVFATTRVARENVPPAVAGTTPADGATGVAATANVEATFVEAMDPATLTGSTITLTPQGGETPVAAQVSYDAAGKKVTLKPNADLDQDTVYTARVTTGAKDLAGNALAAGTVTGASAVQF